MRPAEVYDPRNRIGRPTTLIVEMVEGGYEAKLHVHFDNRTIKLVAAVGRNRFGVTTEVNIYYGSEELEVLNSITVRELARAHLEIADIADMLQQSYPQVPEKLRPYFRS